MTRQTPADGTRQRRGRWPARSTRLRPSRAATIFRLLAVNVAASVLGVVLLLFGLEVFFRFTIPPSTGGSIFEHTLTTKRYKVMKKNARVMPYGRELRTNELGFRDRQLRVFPKAPDELRVVVLGDSFTVSAGVDYDRIYTSLLQHNLRGTWPGARVLNLAVGGYNIIQYRWVVEEVGLGLAPDLVVVAVFPYNDFSNADYRANYRAAQGHPQRSSREPAWHETLYVYRAFLWKIEWRLKAALEAITSPRSSPPAADDGVAPEDTRQHADRRENLSSLLRIARLAASQNVDVLVVTLPNTDDLTPQLEDVDVVRRYCARHGIPFFDLVGSFIETDVHPASLRLNAIDGHPNERYNHLVASVLTPQVASILHGRATLSGGVDPGLPTAGREAFGAITSTQEAGDRRAAGHGVSTRLLSAGSDE